mgnify:FL=1
MRPDLRLAATAALLSLSQPVFAEGNCLQPEDIADATTYAMPLFVEALQSSCADVLPANSYVMNEGPALAAEFQPLRDQAWPGARRLLVGLIEDKTGANRANAEAAGPGMGGVVQTLMRMEGDELRPFVDAIAMQIIAEEIEPDTCGDVDALMPLLAPLPPENYGALLATLMGFVEKKDGELSFCKETSK